MSRVHSLSVLCPCAVLNFNIPSTTEGHLKTKYNVKKKCIKKSTYQLKTKYNVRKILKNPLIYQCTMTYFGMYVFLVGTHWGNIWGKFTTAWVGHNKAEQIIWVNLSIYLSIYIYIHTWICVYEFMNKKCFSRHIWVHACASSWIKSGFPDLPFQDGHKLVVCTDSVICSVTNGVFTADSVCSSAASSFIRKYFSQHISIKSTQTQYMYSFKAQAISLKE